MSAKKKGLVGGIAKASAELPRELHAASPAEAARYPSAAELAQSREWKTFLAGALGAILAASGCGASAYPTKTVTMPAVTAPAIAPATPATSTSVPPPAPPLITPATDPPGIEGGLAVVEPAPLPDPVQMRGQLIPVGLSFDAADAEADVEAEAD